MSECVATLYAHEVRSFRVVPGFFGSGGHLKEDLPRLGAGLKSNFKGLEVTLEPPVGEQPRVSSSTSRACGPRAAVCAPPRGGAPARASASGQAVAHVRPVRRAARERLVVGLDR